MVSLLVLMTSISAAWGQTLDLGEQEWLRQQERERALREQQEAVPEVRLQRPADDLAARIPQDESPCFPIHRIALTGDSSATFDWALAAADLPGDPATGRCMGTQGVNIVMARIQNAIMARGYVTTRVLAAPQDFKTGVLTLTVIPGRVRSVRFAPGTSPRATAINAVPIQRGALLNLRDIEQALENFKRLPTVETDIQITPADGPDARPGESDLVIAWKQARFYRLSASLDDSGGRRTGKHQAGATLSLDHVWTLNDVFYAHVNRAVFTGRGRGTEGHALHYSVPFGYWLISATASGYDYRQAIAGYTQTYEYSGSSASKELRLSRVLYRDASRKTGAHVRAWSRRSRNYIDGTEIDVQRRRTGGWEAGLGHLEYLGTAVLDAAAAYRWGTGAFGAMRAPEEAFDEGTSRSRLITADARLTAPFSLLGQRLRYIAAWRAQWNRTRLVPQDYIAMGGRYTVRGFDGEIMLMGERGWIWRNDLGWQVGAGQELYLGADVGHVGGPSTRGLPSRRMAGAVAGVRGGGARFYWDVFAGKPLHKPKTIKTPSVIAGFNLNWTY